MQRRIFELLQTLATTAGSLASEFSGRFYGQQQSPSSRDFEISTLDYPEDPQVDVVFVHGLGSDSSNAWSCIDASTQGQVSWPVTELPPRLETRSRILAYDYDTDFTTVEYLVSRTLLYQSKRLAEALSRRRQGSSQRPIIFVCHSLGGIVVKNALVYAKSSQRPDLEEVFDAVYGIVFLGTPHTTSPKALADSLSNILVRLGLDTRDSLRHELYSRSTTLAYSLERFKPLATNLSIYAISDTSSLSRQDSGFDKERENDRHIYLSLDRDHAGLAKFSRRTDQDLHHIIDCINKLCVDAVKRTTESIAQKGKASLHPRMSAEDKVHDLGIGKALKTHLKNHPPSLGDAERENFRLLEEHFCRWFKDSPSPSDPDAWPVAILQGPAGSGKTQTALEYVSHHRGQYSSILWVNAANRSSLEFSFRAIASRMVSRYPQSTPSRELLSLDGVSLSDDQERSRGLNEGDLRLIEQAVMEWLARPHEKKWLLIMDSLSPESGYPLSTTWTDWLDQRKSANDWWRNFLEHLPSTTGNRGHIIISTRSDIEQLGPRIIPFTSPKDAGLDPSASSLPETGSRFREWWQTAQVWEKGVLGVTLFLSDCKCPRTPKFLFEPGLVEDESTWTSTPRALKSDGSCIRLANDFLADGPLLLYQTGKVDVENLDLKSEASKTGTQVDKIFVEVLTKTWEALSTGLQAVRNHRDLVTGWDDEKQVAHNISALVRRCDSLTDRDTLKRSLGEGDKHLVNLAAVCEAHAEYETARKLYGLQMERQRLQGKLDLTLQLNCARVFQQSGQFLDAEAQYSNIFATYNKFFETPGIKPDDARITAYRQFASMRASQGKFDEAVKQISQVLALEGPFGDDAQVTESIHELALYLYKSGNGQAASASLQRIVASLEKTRGKMHHVTLSTMEFLSAIKVKIGQIDEAQRLLNAVYDCRLKQLGEKHPKSILCRSKIAATTDLKGNAEEAEAIFIECLDAALESLGPRHPALFSIRDDFAHCLVTLGKQGKAREELEKLNGEFEVSPRLYSSKAIRRIRRLLDCEGDIDFMEMDSVYPTRSTLGVGGFNSEDYNFSDEGSDYDTDED